MFGKFEYRQISGNTEYDPEAFISIRSYKVDEKYGLLYQTTYLPELLDVIKKRYGFTQNPSFVIDPKDNTRLLIVIPEVILKLPNGNNLYCCEYPSDPIQISTETKIEATGEDSLAL